MARKKSAASESDTQTVERSEAALLALLGKSDPLADNGDILADVPFHTLDPAPFNPKRPISGKYRRGLQMSLDHFKLSDTLKVWPNPKSVGRYLVLDGNQRYSVLTEMLEDFLISREAARRVLGELPDDSLAIARPEALTLLKASYKVIFDDELAMQAIRTEIGSVFIPCRIKAALDLEEAKLLNASWDRNRAIFDEGPLADLVDSILETGKVTAEFVANLVRSEHPFVPVVPRPEIRSPDDPDSPPPPRPEPTEDEPWGPPPPTTPTESQSFAQSVGIDVPDTASAKTRTYSVVLALSEDGYRRVTDGPFKSLSRTIREANLLAASDKLELALERHRDKDRKFNQAWLVLALLTMAHQAEILEPEPEPEEESDD